MATYAEIQVATALDGEQLTANQFRLDMASLACSHGLNNNMASRSGVRYTNSSAFLVNPIGGMDVTVSSGLAIVQGETTSYQGAYFVSNAVSQTLTHETADAVHPRYDLVVINIDDNGDSSSTTRVAIVKGTASATPAVPTTADNTLVLAKVYIAAGETDLVGHVTDMRVWTVASGGILPVTNSSSLPTAYSDGVFTYDIANKQIYVTDSSSQKNIKSMVTSTSSTRPSTPLQDTVIRETDTDHILYYNGSDWALFRGSDTCASSSKPDKPREGSQILESDTYNTLQYQDSAWRPVHPHICTSSTRPSNAREGTIIYETNTDVLSAYSGSLWFHVANLETESYSTTWSASATPPSIGNGDIDFYYSRYGNDVFFYLKLTAGSTTTFGSGTWTFTVPHSINSSIDFMATARANDYSTGAKHLGIAVTWDTDKISLLIPPSLGALNSVNSVFPFVWGSLDELIVHGRYVTGSFIS